MTRRYKRKRNVNKDYYSFREKLPSKKFLGQAAGAVLGFITADVPGAIEGYSVAGKWYDMTHGDSAKGIGTSVSMKDPPGVVNPFINNPFRGQSYRREGLNAPDRPKILSKNSTNMGYNTPYRRTPRSTGSSLFRSRSSYVSRSGYRGIRRSRYTRRFRYRYRPRRFNRFRRRFARGRFAKRRRAVKRYARKRRRVNKKNLKPNVLRSKGYESKVETYGAITDAHCVYLKHSSFHIEHIAETISAALIRKLFKKMGYDIPDMDIILSGVGPGTPDASKYRLLFQTIDPASTTGLVDFYAFTFAATDTLADVARNVSSPKTLYNYLVGYMLDKNDVEALSLELQVSDNSGSPGPNFITFARIDMQNEYLYLNVRSVLRMQNRTLAPAGTEGQDTARLTDVVDNQPLSGKVFTFKHGDPRLRYGSQPPLISQGGVSFGSGDTAQIGGVNWTGFDLIRATTLPNKYEEPPNKDHFVNCVSAKKFVLNVGACMQTGLSWRVHGRFTNVLKKFKPQRGTTSITSLDRVFKIAGKSQLVCMEEFIRTENANTVKVGYEREYSCAASLVTKPKSSMSTKFSVDAVRNNP